MRTNLVKQFEGHEVRIVQDEQGEPWWVGKDVCDVLGYSNARDAMAKHCKGVAKRYPLLTDGGTQHVRVLSEPDLYRLIVGSNMPGAVRFERWVFEDVLPSIRKRGLYATPGTAEAILNDPDVMIRILQELKAERQLRQAAEPKAALWDKTAAHGGDQTVRELGKELGIGVNTLYKALAAEKMIYRHNGAWVPMQNQIETGRLRVVRSTYQREDGPEHTYFKIFVTPKGRKFICERLQKAE